MAADYRENVGAGARIWMVCFALFAVPATHTHTPPEPLQMMAMRGVVAKFVGAFATKIP